MNVFMYGLFNVAANIWGYMSTGLNVRKNCEEWIVEESGCGQM
jgi:hypothetical protein